MKWSKVTQMRLERYKASLEGLHKKNVEVQEYSASLFNSANLDLGKSGFREGVKVRWYDHEPGVFHTGVLHGKPRLGDLNGTWIWAVQVIERALKWSALFWVPVEHLTLYQKVITKAKAKKTALPLTRKVLVHKVLVDYAKRRGLPMPPVAEAELRYALGQPVPDWIMLVLLWDKKLRGFAGAKDASQPNTRLIRDLKVLESGRPIKAKKTLALIRSALRGHKVEVPEIVKRLLGSPRGK